MSDLKFESSRDDEAIDDLRERTGVSVELTRWDADGISYQDGRTTKQGRATITQFLKRGSNEVGGYEIYFDKAYPVGEAKTLEEAKQKLLNYINNKRR